MCKPIFHQHTLLLKKKHLPYVVTAETFLQLFKNFWNSFYDLYFSFFVALCSNTSLSANRSPLPLLSSWE